MLVLRVALDRAGIKQSTLASHLHVTPAAVSKWVRGKSMPSPERVARIEKFLGIPAKRLFAQVRVGDGKR
jgi:transcriptional regulator with XRE-family HTH domain